MSSANLDGDANGEAERGHDYRWRALAALYLAMFMTILDVSVVNLALPSIRADLDASDSDVEWVLVVYVLVFAAALLPFGRFGDVAGRDRMFRWGVAGFSLSSLACGLAPDIFSLIMARALQGLSAAALVPQVLAIVHVLFPDRQKGRAIGLFGTVGALGAVAGPLIGGVLVSADIAGTGWRPIFLINLPIGLISMAAAFRYVPVLKSAARVMPDWRGTVLFALAVLALVFPLVEGRQFGWPIWCFGLVVLGTVFGGLFYRQQLRNARTGRAQLLPVVLTRDRIFVAGVLYSSVFFSCLAGLFFMLAIYLQSGLGLTPLEAGLMLAAHPAGVILASYATGRLGGRLPVLRITLGTLTVLGGLVAFRLAAGDAGGSGIPAGLLMPLLAVGLGTGTLIPALFQRVLSRVSGEDAGAGAGVLQAFQQVGMALGVAIQGQIFFQVLGHAPEATDYLPAARMTLAYPIAVLAVLPVTLAVPMAVLLAPRRAFARSRGRAGPGQHKNAPADT